MISIERQLEWRRSRPGKSRPGRLRKPIRCPSSRLSRSAALQLSVSDGWLSFLCGKVRMARSLSKAGCSRVRPRAPRVSGSSRPLKAVPGPRSGFLPGGGLPVLRTRHRANPLGLVRSERADPSPRRIMAVSGTELDRREETTSFLCVTVLLNTEPRE